MALFTVENIIDGNTIQVPGWKWGDGYSGKLVKIQGYSIPDSTYDSYVKTKLKNLLEGKSVELKNVIHVEKGSNPDEDIVHCSVYLNEINIATYFGELTLK